MATVRLNRGRWVADYRDQHGRRRIEAPKGLFENKAQEKSAAHSLLSHRLAEIASGNYQAHRLRLNFTQLATRHLESKANIRATTRRGYESLLTLYLTPYFGSWKVADISAADIERFQAELTNGLPPPIAEAFAQRQAAAQPGLAEARAKQRSARTTTGVRTINKCLTLMTMVLNYALRHQWVHRNVAEHVEKINQPAHMTTWSTPTC